VWTVLFTVVVPTRPRRALAAALATVSSVPVIVGLMIAYGPTAFRPDPGQFFFWLGIALVVAAVNSPIDALGEEDFFFVHMSQHMLLGDLAPLCFVAGLTGPVLRPVLALRPFDKLRVLTHPFVALPLWAVNLYIWHVPFLYQAALHHDSVHALEHALFFTAGAIMWSPVLETLPAPVWFGTGWKLGYVALVRMIETVLGKAEGNQSAAAAMLGIDRNTLRKKIQQLRIKA